MIGYVPTQAKLTNKAIYKLHSLFGNIKGFEFEFVVVIVKDSLIGLLAKFHILRIHVKSRHIFFKAFSFEQMQWISS